jgi:transcriptional regulator GlxA family with amidase domain
MDPASAPPVNTNTGDLNTDVPTGMGTDAGMRTRRSKSGRFEAQSHTDTERNLALPPSAIQVLFVLLPNSLTLDWAGPAEVLRSANSVLQGMGQPPRFAVGFVGPEDQPVTSVGVRLADVAPLPDLSHAKLSQPTWVVLVGEPGDCMHIDTPAARATLHWLRSLRLQPGGLELITVCAGAVLAAHAGLLTSRDATTHHQHLDELRQADPTCRVQSNRVFVSDGPVCSSAGVTTGIDLMLHRVSTVCGPVVAAKVAQALVVALRRGPQDAELSPFLAHRNHLHPAVHKVQDAVSQATRHDWSLANMADVACTSTRHLARLFETHAGVAPLQYLRSIRLAAAQTALHSGLNVNQAADMAGFSSDTQLRRAWHQAGLAGTPSQHAT